MVRTTTTMPTGETPSARNTTGSPRADWSILLDDSDVCIVMLCPGGPHYSSGDSGDPCDTSAGVDICFDFAPLN